MSTDFAAVCHTCRLTLHLGQRMADVYSFGYGSNDKEGADFVLRWLERHACGWWEGATFFPAHDVRVMVSDNAPEDYERARDPSSVPPVTRLDGRRKR